MNRILALRAERRQRKEAAALLARLLQPRPQFRVETPKLLIARALWDYGEDDLVERALAMTEDEHRHIEAIEAWYESPEYPLPMSGQRITHNHVSAFAAITLFEGRVRPLARTRRRAEKDRPDVFRADPTSHPHDR